MNPTCGTVQELIFDHTWLRPEERQMLLAHLETCGECRQIHDVVCEFGTLLYENAQAEMPVDMTERVMVSLAEEETLQEMRGLDLGIGIVLCAQVVALIGLRTNVLNRLRDLHTGWRWLLGEVAQPVFSGCWTSLNGTLSTLTGSAQVLRVPELGLPIAVGAILFCLISGGILYGEEKYHG